MYRANSSPPTPEQDVHGNYIVNVVDVFSEACCSCKTQPNLIISLGTCVVHLNVLGSDALIGCALIRQGIIPSAPGRPSVAITIQTLELYRLAHFRCPQLSISAFVKVLSDIHSVCYIALNNPETILTISFLSLFLAPIQKISCPSILHCIRCLPCHLG